MFTQRNLIIAFSTLGILALGIMVYVFLNSAPTATAGNSNTLFGSLFPFRSSPTATPNTTATTTIETSGEAPRLRHITEKSISGAGFMGTSSIRFMERETGHIYETPSDSLTLTRIANTTIPGVQELTWGKGGFFIARFLDEAETIQSIYGTLASSTQEQTLAARPGPTYSLGVLSSDSNVLWAVTKTETGSHSDLIDTKTMKPVTIFQSPIKSWIPLMSENNIYLATAPNSNTPGSLYRVGKDTKLNKIIGNIPGLLASVSPSGRYVLYSSATVTNVTTWLRDTEENKDYKIPLATLPQKCAWIPKNEPQLFCGVPGNLPIPGLPEAWLLGLATLSDRAWIIEPTMGRVSAVDDLSYEQGQPIDIINPILSSDATVVIFTNKTDLSLWSLRLR